MPCSLEIQCCGDKSKVPAHHGGKPLHSAHRWNLGPVITVHLQLTHGWNTNPDEKLTNDFCIFIGLLTSASSREVTPGFLLLV